jgi:hypothetical protein
VQQSLLMSSSISTHLCMRPMVAAFAFLRSTEAADTQLATTKEGNVLRWPTLSRLGGLSSPD